jgi:hypothetical protein
MSWVAVAIGGSAVIGAAVSSSAAGTAADAQRDASQAGIGEQQRQFDSIQKMLAPYRDAGTAALGGQQALAGLNGGPAQQQAIDALQRSPAFTSAMQLGETGILQNASATGGLRGGNTQGALAQFRPQLLAASINDQYARLGGLSSMGLGAAGQTGQFAQSATNNITGLLQQQGAAGAGAALAQGRAFNGALGGLGQAFGYYQAQQPPPGYYGGTYTGGADPLGGFITANGGF